MGSTRSESSSSLNRSQHGQAIFWVNGAQSVHTELKINTGNKKGVYRGINDTYTLNDKSGTLELEATALGYNDGVLKRGDVLEADFEGKIDTTGYYIYGHPDKFEYDYTLKYDNSGLNSALNLLAMAGKIDVFEKNSHYEDYKNTPIGVKKNDLLGEEYIYPKEITENETEDQFLFDCIKQGFAISTKDPSEYNTINDLVKEDGGGIKTLFESIESDYPYQEGIESVCKLLGKYGVSAKAETLEVKGIKEVEKESTEGSETEGGTASTEEENKPTLNREKYDFCVRLAEIVKEGKGCIVTGNGYRFDGEEEKNIETDKEIV